MKETVDQFNSDTSSPLETTARPPRTGFKRQTGQGDISANKQRRGPSQLRTRRMNKEPRPQTDFQPQSSFGAPYKTDASMTRKRAGGTNQRFNLVKPNPMQTRDMFDNQEPARIQKWLSEQGLGSRREIEEWIARGEIMIDGMIASLGTKIYGHEKIMLRGQPLDLRRIDTDSLEMLIYHKPAGEIVTYDDPHGRPTVFDHLPRPKEGKWVSVGRLDFNSEGLLVLTNSGDLAHRLMHPRFQIEREYAVRIRGELSKEDQQTLLRGIDIDDEKDASFITIEDAGGRGSNHWYHVTLSEGRYREVRRMMEAVGHEVNRLIRVRYGHFKLPPQLNVGRFLRFYGEKVLEIFAQINGSQHKEKRKDTSGFTGFLRGTSIKRQQDRQVDNEFDQVGQVKPTRKTSVRAVPRQRLQGPGNKNRFNVPPEKRTGLRLPFKRKENPNKSFSESRAHGKETTSPPFQEITDLGYD